MSAPLYPERLSCMSCGTWLTMAEQRHPAQTCELCRKEERTRQAQTRTINAIFQAVTP